MNTFLLQVNQTPITTQTQVQPSTSTYVPKNRKGNENPTTNPKQIKKAQYKQNHTGPNYVTYIPKIQIPQYHQSYNTNQYTYN